MFSVSKRARGQMMKGMGRLVDADIEDTIAGRAQFRWTRGASITVGVVIAAMALAYAVGVVLVPGFLVFFGIFHSVRPPRVIALTDSEAIVASRSFLTGKPSDVVARSALGSFDATGRTITIGNEQITLSSGEHKRLLTKLRVLV